jgi:hypothetical protein
VRLLSACWSVRRESLGCKVERTSAFSGRANRVLCQVAIAAFTDMLWFKLISVKQYYMPHWRYDFRAACDTYGIPVAHQTSQAMLHSCLQSDAIGIRPFSRWLRALCTVLLARNRVEDRKKAISYIEQALPVLQQGGCDSDQAQVRRARS